jgi:hypothetical protein
MALNAKQKARQKAKRRTARIKSERAALYDPGAQLSGARLRRAANQLTALEVNPQRRALRNEMTQATAQGTELANRTKDYYSQIAQSESDNVARQQALGADLQGRLKGIGDQSQAALSQIGTEADQRASADTAVRGGGLGGGGSERVAAEVAAQRGLALQGAQSASSQGELSTANWSNLANIAAQARGMQGGESLGRVQNALSAQQGDIRNKQIDLEGKVAQTRMKNILDLRQQGYENIVTAEGLGIDRAKIAASVQSDKRAAALARQRIKSSERQNRQRVAATKRGQDVSSQTHALDRASRERIQAANRQSREAIANAKKKGNGKLEPADARKLKGGIANALADLDSVKPKNPEKWLRKQGAPGVVIRAAKEIRDGQRPWLQPSTVQQLRSLGMTIPQRWLPPSMRKGAKLGTPAIPHNKI